ncbi:GPI mannosyltransferase 2 [Nilaparvata lugens]|uniref:GPI mannosyltransferase 2 n=1 Tax=Nilaparvata lugens TaxID=108931 RepID=UPI00193D54F3|nr:GPI mannosyltransferase 2 [Nilaparvata lugens]
MYSPREKIFWFSVFSRCTLLCISSISNALLQDHRAEGVFLSSIPCDRNLNKLPKNQCDINHSPLDYFIHVFFGGLVRWDAHYFLHIAKNDYSQEKMLAFFPFYPLIVRTLATFLNIFSSTFVTYESLLILTSIVINFMLFVKSALVLYDLSCAVLKNTELSYKAAILYCINPASVFFSAPYSETCYAFLTFSAMLYCVENKLTISSVVNGLSSMTRSNGILNVGFVLHKLLNNFIIHYSSKSKSFLISASVIINNILTCLGSLIVSILPFCAFQLFSYVKFCHESLYKNDRPWCNRTIPLAYSYVQDYYWNVGFLRYYRIKQIPNFLLALPLVFIIIRNSITEFRKNGFYYERIKSLFLTTNEHHLVFKVHALCLTIFCVLCIHVQVTTRMLCSSSPVLYWYCAQYFIDDDDKKLDHKMKLREKLSCKGILRPNMFSANNEFSRVDSKSNMVSRYRVFLFDKIEGDRRRVCSLIKIYFVSYFVIGTIMFSNFYPFT